VPGGRVHAGRAAGGRAFAGRTVAGRGVAGRAEGSRAGSAVCHRAYVTSTAGGSVAGSADPLPMLPGAGRAIGHGRRWGGALLATLGVCLLTAALLPLRNTLSLPSHLLLYLLAVVVVSLVGGIWPAILAA